MPLDSYQPGWEAPLFYAAETAAYPGGVAIPTPALPSTFVFGGWCDVPEITIDEGSRPIYSVGADDPLTVLPGGRVHRLSVGARIANMGLIGLCFKNGTGFRNLPDVCFLSGSADPSDGFGRAFRYGKAESIGFTLAKGSGQELRAQMSFLGLAEQNATLPTPSNSDLGAYGVPLTWHNLTQVNFGGVNLRDIADSISFNTSYQLEMKNFRPDFGASNVWSRTPYAIMPIRRSYSLTVNFEDPDARKYALGISRATTNSATATGAISCVATNVGSSTEGAYSNGFTLAAAAGRLGTTTRRGGDTGQELMSSATIQVTGVTFTPLT
ncbi:hypothetical protein IAD21_00888 [Abditibacteriota bacterium]|nr:hypothetical protein IAD21_00888 [Abditibacteriota bacterium]